jgi:hypothetical protein
MKPTESEDKVKSNEEKVAAFTKTNMETRKKGVVSMAKQDRHGWLRDALADKSKRGSDLARAWGVDDSMVSRFIAKGEPILTLPRMEILASMLNMDLNSLGVKLATRPVPAAVLNDHHEPKLEPPTATDAAAMAKLKTAVDEASRHFKARGYQVTVCIEYSGE